MISDELLDPGQLQARSLNDPQTQWQFSFRNGWHARIRLVPCKESEMRTHIIEFFRPTKKGTFHDATSKKPVLSRSTIPFFPCSPSGALKALVHTLKQVCQ